MIPEFMIRVKLPSPNSFPSCPSGDTDYERAWNEALAKARPQGFEYIYPRMGETWPKDSEGYTWARLRCTDETLALNTYMERVRKLEDTLEALKNFADGMMSLIPKG